MIATVLPSISFIITNNIIFTYARRSRRRVQPMDRDSVQAPGLSSREARLLKHMIFLFVVFFCGWTPIYIIRTVYGTADVISAIAENVFLTIPAISVIIAVADLFLYNHELRKYFTNQWLMFQNSRIRE